MDKNHRGGAVLCFAPMEGITGGQFRRVHRKYFPGVDRYYMPFISPTQEHRFTPRELRNIAPEANEGVPAVPQLLTRNAADFIWAARELGRMGYGEVNLNLGCPSATVVTKGKGAGMLADPQKLDEFLDAVFSAGLEVDLSLKTRLGLKEPEEFPALVEVFNRYPVSLLIIHPRVREDFYRHPVRREAFAGALPSVRAPVCYNGGLVSAADCAGMERDFPGLPALMAGQGLLADPALAEKYKGGPGADRERLLAFHDELYRTYLRDFGSRRNTVFHMKELWSYLIRLFDGGDKPMKAIRKAQDGPDYEGAVREIFRLPLREDADWN